MDETDGIKPGQAAPSRPMTPLSRKGHNIGMMVLGGLLFLSIVIPYLFWQSTWFGRTLTDDQMQQYLQDTGQPRHTQHALVQISDRIIAGESSVTRWYPAVQLLAAHELEEVRVTTAWVMGQDNQSETFHAALQVMLGDESLLVRRNAALSLVRFNDRAGKAEIRAMLEPFTFHSPRTGVIRLRLAADDSVNPGTMLARMNIEGEEKEFEVRSPLPGALREWLVEDGAQVFEGLPLAVLAPADGQAREALRALYLIGGREDLPLVNQIAGGKYNLSNDTRQQAILTAEAIQTRPVEQPKEETVED